MWPPEGIDARSFVCSTPTPAASAIAAGGRPSPQGGGEARKRGSRGRRGVDPGSRVSTAALRAAVRPGNAWMRWAVARLCLKAATGKWTARDKLYDLLISRCDCTMLRPRHDGDTPCA
jgi:hypothetical protein